MPTPVPPDTPATPDSFILGCTPELHWYDQVRELYGPWDFRQCKVWIQDVALDDLDSTLAVNVRQAKAWDATFLGQANTYTDGAFTTAQDDINTVTQRMDNFTSALDSKTNKYFPVTSSQDGHVLNFQPNGAMLIQHQNCEIAAGTDLTTTWTYGTTMRVHVYNGITRCAVAFYGHMLNGLAMNNKLIIGSGGFVEFMYLNSVREFIITNVYRGNA